MAEIDRRTMVRGMLYFAAFAAAGGAAVTAPELAKAVPLAADKAGPAETDDGLDRDGASDNDELVGTDDLSELLQHEYDHLDGILAVSRAIDGHSFALRSQRPYLNH